MAAQADDEALFSPETQKLVRALDAVHAAYTAEESLEVTPPLAEQALDTDCCSPTQDEAQAQAPPAPAPAPMPPPVFAPRHRRSHSGDIPRASVSPPEGGSAVRKSRAKESENSAAAPAASSKKTSSQPRMVASRATVAPVRTWSRATTWLSRLVGILLFAALLLVSTGCSALLVALLVAHHEPFPWCRWPLRGFLEPFQPEPWMPASPEAFSLPEPPHCRFSWMRMRCQPSFDCELRWRRWRPACGLRPD